MHKPGEQINIRMKLKSGETKNKVSRNIDELLDYIERQDEKATAVWHTLNKIRDDAKIRGWEGAKTEDIESLEWLLIDTDPERESSTSATDAEKEAARELSGQIREFLVSRGFPDPIVADSGNGYHVLYKIHEPVEHSANIKRFFVFLKEQFSKTNPQAPIAHVDTSVHDPPRVAKLYGTLAGKGQPSEERPHRMSRLISVPETIETVDIDKILSILPPEPPTNHQEEETFIGECEERTRTEPVTDDISDVKKYLDAHKVVYREGKKAGQKFYAKLAQCPFNPAHEWEAWISHFDDGGKACSCPHEHCANMENRWSDFRDILEPGRREKREKWERRDAINDSIRRGAIRWEKSRSQKTGDVDIERRREELSRVALYFRSLSGKDALNDTEIIRRLTTVNKNAMMEPVSDDIILDILTQSKDTIKEYWEIRDEIQTTKKTTIDLDTREKALAVLTNPDENVVEYLMRDFHRSHVGDRYVGLTNYASIGSMRCTNTSGLHPGLGGRSGEGKSHAARTTLHQLPEGCKKAGRRSDMALFYSEYPPGTVVFFDDAKNISETMQDIIKQATTEYQKDYAHEVVKVDRSGTDVLYISKRTSWWLTVADPSFNIQFLNRQINASVDETEAQDEKIHQKQMDRAGSGEPEFPEDEQTEIVRAMFYILLREDAHINVVIPFSHRILWNNKRNRTNFPKFIDTIRAFAALNSYRRERDERGNVIANKEDYALAAELWGAIGKSQSKLTPQELLVWSVLMEMLKKHPEGVARADLAADKRLREMSKGELSFSLHGRKKGDGTYEGGIENKIPGVSIEIMSDSIKYSDGSIRRKNVEMIKFFGDFSFLDQYERIVMLKPDDE